MAAHIVARRKFDRPHTPGPQRSQGRHTRSLPIARRPHAAPQPSRQKGPRINTDIRADNVLLIDQDGEKRGRVSLDEALGVARAAGLDLVEVADNPDLPVVKVLDYGKLRFENQKKKAAARKRQKTQELKEIKLRPNIDTHDYDVKMRHMEKFLSRGDKVKVTVRFRGREMAHLDRGRTLLARVQEDFDELAKVESQPSQENRLMTMVMAPR